MIDRPTIVVVAYSARSLASSAKRAGFAPLSIDVFGDDDTRKMSLASVKLDGGLSDGLTLDKVARAVEMLVDAHDPIGLAYGAGFEHQPETIAAFARATRVFGNESETVKRAKDPLALAQICEANGVRHPQVAFAPPDDPELWLVKSQGAPAAAISRRVMTGTTLHRIVIFNAALAARTSRHYSSRARKKRKSLASACSGLLQHLRRRFDMAAPLDPSTSIPPRRGKSLAPSPRLLPNWILSALTVLIFWFRPTRSGS